MRAKSRNSNATGKGQGVRSLSPKNEVESRKNKVTGINIRKTLRNN